MENKCGARLKYLRSLTTPHNQRTGGSVADSLFSFCGYRENPFGVNPDPRFLFWAKKWKEPSEASSSEFVIAPA